MLKLLYSRVQQGRGAPIAPSSEPPLAGNRLKPFLFFLDPSFFFLAAQMITSAVCVGIQTMMYSRYYLDALRVSLDSPSAWCLDEAVDRVSALPQKISFQYQRPENKHWFKLSDKSVLGNVFSSIVFCSVVRFQWCWLEVLFTFFVVFRFLL